MDEGLLVVDRTSPEDIKMRDLYLLVDEWPEETLLYGESYEVKLPPGEHRLKITNRLFSKTAEFTVEPNKTVRFRAANVASKGFLSLLVGITGSGAYKVKLEAKK